MRPLTSSTKRRRVRRDRSRPSGSTRPSLKQQLDAPFEPRRRADPRTVRRALALSALMALMLVILTPTLRSYLQQRSEIADLKRQKVSAQARVSDLEAERKRWDDPAYVKQQAGARLGFAAPGQSVTVYVDDKAKPHAVGRGTGVSTSTALSGHPWYGQVWGSISSPAQKDDE